MRTPGSASMWVQSRSRGTVLGMPLFNKLASFARSPQGRRAAQKAMQFANSPQGKAKIAAARDKFAKRPPRQGH